MGEKKKEIRIEDLSNWKMIKNFQEELARVTAKAQMDRTFSDSRRELGYAPYLSLFLLGIFNPVVTSMRAICAISGFEKVQEQTGCGPVSLGSFSEIQHVIDPDLLKQVFENMSEQVVPGQIRDKELSHLELIVQDGSLWRALPRMAWAEYGVGNKGTAKGVRLHLRFNIHKDCPVDAMVSTGKGCEARALREMLLPGQTNVGDRYYGKDYSLFRQIHEAGAFFVFRINDKAVVHCDQELPLSPQDRAAGVLRHAWVHLGATPQVLTIRLRLIEVLRDGQHLLLITNHTEEKASAELVALIYRRRWSIELFFAWIKCILGCRHFMAESINGVAIQLYLALIASLMLQLFTGKRPNKRTMELIHFYFMGWATAQEAVALILKHSTKTKTAKIG